MIYRFRSARATGWGIIPVSRYETFAASDPDRFARVLRTACIIHKCRRTTSRSQPHE